MSRIIISLVRLYQKIPHPKLCRFQPPCSAYMILAIEKCGSVKGFLRGFGEYSAVTLFLRVERIIRKTVVLVAL